MHPSYPPHLNSNHPHLQIQQEHDQASHTATSHISHSLHQQPQAQHIRSLEHQETYHGFVKEKQDAILLVEACIANQLHAITPHDLSVGMASLPMRNGTIIVFVESSAQVAKMRWRDAGLWSSSRISGPFLLYREIESSNQKKPNIPQSEQGGLFSTSSLRPYTRLVEGGLAKRTVTIVGSDGNRYRVINYFYPAEVEGFFRKGGRAAGLSLKVPSEVAEFDQYKPPRWTEEPVILPPLRNLGVALPPLRSVLREDETSEYIKRHIREKEEQ